MLKRECFKNNWARSSATIIKTATPSAQKFPISLMRFCCSFLSHGHRAKMCQHATRRQCCTHSFPLLHWAMAKSARVYSVKFFLARLGVWAQNILSIKYSKLIVTFSLPSTTMANYYYSAPCHLLLLLCHWYLVKKRFSVPNIPVLNLI